MRLSVIIYALWVLVFRWAIGIIIIPLGLTCAIIAVCHMYIPLRWEITDAIIGTPVMLLWFYVMTKIQDGMHWLEEKSTILKEGKTLAWTKNERA